MLTNNVIATPRPRPPAKTRRSFSTKLKPTSPPSYPGNFRFPTNGGLSRGNLLGSPVSLTAQITEWDSRIGSQKHCHPADDSNWMNAASREELYDLFTKADDLIKERESELSMTSAVCRSLYDHNVALKNKHEALLARIPGTPSQSTTPSPVPYMSPLVQSPHYYSDSLSLRNPTNSLTDNNTPSSQSPPHIRHNRRVSVCPLDIALLSDQNAELLDKVEKLESESTQADQTGRRALKKLEKEIQDLREELEKTQAKGDELEEKAKSGFGERMVEEMWKQKEEREDRLKALRRKPGDVGHEDGEHEIRDFAPGGALWSANPSSDRSSFPAAKHLNSQNFPTTPPPDINLATKPVSPPETYDIGSPSSIASLPQQEYAVVSQLLLKIRELEETNARISAQQAETAAKLRAVHRDTRRISKLYECLGDQTGVEWEAEEGQMKNSMACDVVRFQSLRKSLEKDLSDPAMDDDVFGTAGAKTHSTIRGAAALNFNTVKRTRKTVVGLFDTPTSKSVQPELQSLNTKDSTLPLSLLPPADPDTSRMSWLMGVASPALSEISLGTQIFTETSTSEGPGRTLGSELGSEFGDDWGLNAGNHHLRKSSLYDLCRLSTAQSTPAGHFVNPSTPEAAGGLQTPESMIHDILLGVDTTPRPPKGGEQTTRRRINRRLTNTPVQEADWEEAADVDMHISRPLTPIKRLSGAFDVMVETFAVGGPEKDAVTENQSSKDVVQTPAETTKKEGFMAFMLELWLWIQFIIIILVFLWAMAKRGPKAVLGDAAHRRTKLRH